MRALNPVDWLARIAGANPRIIALCPPLPGQWSSVGLSTLLAMHLFASAGGTGIFLIVHFNGLPSLALMIGLMFYVLLLIPSLKAAPILLSQFDRAGPDRPLARWVLGGIIMLAVLALTVIIALPFEAALTDALPLRDWADFDTPASALRWALRGVVLVALLIPLAVRRALALSPAYGSLCRAEFRLSYLYSFRNSVT